MFGLFKKANKDFRAEVRPGGHTLHVKAGENLLRSALEAGLPWPHDCRVGSCGTCRCRLVEGKIKPLNDFSYVLTGEELAQGMILACQSSLRSDIVVEVALDTTHHVAGVATVPGVIASTRSLTHDILEVVVKLDKPLPRIIEAAGDGHGYIAGQYADISVPAIEKPRSYSFATAPQGNQDKLTFYIRLVPGGQMTTWLFQQDRAGEQVTVSGPYGSFWLREGETPILCVAGGSGMSSIKALLEQAVKDGCRRDVVYLFGARRQRDLYCLEEMAALQDRWHRNGASFRFVPILSEEPAESDWEGPRGFVTQYIDKYGLDLGACQAYLCGPPPMIDAAIEVLHRAGVDDSNIHFDKFLDASSMPGGRR